MLVFPFFFPSYISIQTFYHALKACHYTANVGYFCDLFASLTRHPSNNSHITNIPPQNKEKASSFFTYAKTLVLKSLFARTCYLLPSVIHAITFRVQGVTMGNIFDFFDILKDEY